MGGLWGSHECCFLNHELHLLGLPNEPTFGVYTRIGWQTGKCKVFYLLAFHTLQNHGQLIGDLDII